MVREQDRTHDALAVPEPPDRFRAWAAAVRASVGRIEALAEESRERGRALSRLLGNPNSDPTTVGRLEFGIRRCRLEIRRIIRALPALDEIERTTGRRGSSSSSPADGDAGSHDPGSGCRA